MQLKMAIIGNIASGKTRLSRRLSEIYRIPSTHVDSIQFLPGLRIRSLDETKNMLDQVMTDEHWLIDGYGPLNLLESRFEAADWIVFIDLPISQHLWWLTKRQITNIWHPREELPAGCNELSLEHTRQLYKRLWGMHTKMRPEILKLLKKESLQKKVIYIRTKKQWDQIYKNGINR